MLGMAIYHKINLEVQNQSAAESPDKESQRQ